MERSAGGGELIDPFGDFRIFHQGGGVVRFDAGINNQRASAAPMFLMDGSRDAVDVRRRVRARKRDPQKIA